MATRAQWKPLDLSELQRRLEEAKLLLEQAGAIAVAQDTGRIAVMAELQKRNAEEQRGDPHRRHYR